MRRVVFLSMLAAILAAAGCQSASSVQDGPVQRAGAPVCNSKLAEAGYCYGIAIPSQPGR